MINRLKMNMKFTFLLLAPCIPDESFIKDTCRLHNCTSGFNEYDSIQCNQDIM